MERTSAARPPLRLLSLDGGGIRGLSELYILDVIMHRVQLAANLNEVPLPADYFDLICGTSTGGLIAILLGRLRLSVPQAIEKYGELSKHVFSEQKRGWQDGKFKASRLEEAIRKVLIDTLGKGRDEERMLDEGVVACKTFVCAVPAHQVNSSPRLFRSYVTRNPSYSSKIWEAARATSAAPGFFKRISIGEPGVQEDFVDGALGYNNPVQLAVQEAIEGFDPETKVACIVSIGTGKTRLAGFKKPGLLQRVIPVDLIKTLATMATSSETASKILEDRYRHCPGLYHRLNVETGLTEIALGEWERLSEVKTHTLAYLRLPEVDAKIDNVVNCLLGKATHTYSLGTLDGSFRETILPSNPNPATTSGPTADSGRFMYPSFAVTHFVNRAEPLEALEGYFDPVVNVTNVFAPKVVVLQGMGGCGKSQLALEYCKRARRDRKYVMIFWIDATSSETTLQSFTKVAEALSKPGFQATDIEANLQYVRKTLDEDIRRWLLVFDNFDDPSSFRTKRLKDYFPSIGPGSILITSRQAEVRSMGHYSLEVNQLSEAEALEVLLRRTRRKSPEPDVTNATKIVKRLGYHALAIDQAGAYILNRGMEFAAYLDCYNRQREKVLNEAPEIWDYTKISKGSTEGARNCTVFATLELSLDSLSGEEQVREDKEHILSLMAFFDINKLTDTLFAPYGSENGSWMPLSQDSDGWNSEAFRDILSELHNLSLLQSLSIDSSEASFSIHPLVQDWLKARIGNQQAKQYFVESMLVLSAYLWKHGAKDYFSDADFNAKQFMLAHVDATIQAKQEFYDSWSFLRGQSLLGAGSTYYVILDRQGRSQQAEEICGAVLGGTSNELGEEHPDTLVAMHNLSTYLTNQGKYEEAEYLLRKCVTIEIKVNGKEAAETLQSMNVLTSLLIRQEKHEEADKVSEEAVEVSVRVLGRDHIYTISIVRNRADVLMRLANHSEAERMNKENLEISKRVLGIQHPQTLTTMNNLALCLGGMEKFEEAETFLREVLSLKEGVHGPDHPDTLTTIFTLACNLYQQEKLTEAEELFWRAYPAYESAYGWHHPQSIAFLSWMALCLRDLGKHEEEGRIRNLWKASKEAREKQLLEESVARMAVSD